MAGEAIVWFALALGALWLGMSAALASAITRRLLVRAALDDGPLVRWLPAAAGLFFLLTGAVQNAFVSGFTVTSEFCAHPQRLTPPCSSAMFQ